VNPDDIPAEYQNGNHHDGIRPSATAHGILGFFAFITLGFLIFGTFGIEMSFVSVGVFFGPTRLIIDDLGCLIESKPTLISGEAILIVALDDLGSALAFNAAGFAGDFGGFIFMGFLGLLCHIVFYFRVV